MIGQRGGQIARGGTYWSLSTGEFMSLPEEGGILPGGQEVRYLRAPMPVAMLLGPLMGLGFVIFLPFIGIMAVAGYFGQRAARSLQAAARGAVAVAVPAWVPGVSYLARRQRQRTAPVQEPEATPEKGLLSALEEEIRARRQDEE